MFYTVFIGCCKNHLKLFELSKPHNFTKVRLGPRYSRFMLPLAEVCLALSLGILLLGSVTYVSMSLSHTLDHCLPYETRKILYTLAKIPLMVGLARAACKSSLVTTTEFLSFELFCIINSLQRKLKFVITDNRNKIGCINIFQIE